MFRAVAPNSCPLLPIQMFHMRGIRRKGGQNKVSINVHEYVHAFLRRHVTLIASK